MNGDTYVFLLGNTLDDWHSSRREFVKVAGPTPVLPDYAFGTWFTWWHSYTEEEAKGEVERWQTDSLPIDIWVSWISSHARAVSDTYQSLSSCFVSKSCRHNDAPD